MKLTGDGDVTLESQNDSLLTENAHSSLLTVNSGDLLFLDLDNFHNTIEGAGTIGSGEYLKLLNQAQATINANVSGAMLALDTGNTIINKGTLEATGGGELDIQDGKIHNAGTIDNGDGIIVDSGSELVVDTATLKLTGSGDVTLENGTLENGGMITESASYVLAHSGAILTLDNIDNTIEGAGTIGTGDGHFKLENRADATIDANVSGAMLTLDTGNTIINKGTLEATGGGELDIQDGKIYNAGTIDNGDGIIVDSGSELVVDTATLKLTGSGDVTLENGTLENGGMITESASYVLAHSGAILTLDNIDNTIEGAGTIGTGDGHFKLENRADATIDANVSGAMLTLDTGNTIINKGVLEATGGGTLIVDDAVKGSGAAAISGGSTADFQSAFNQNVTFSGGGTFEFNSSLESPLHRHNYRVRRGRHNGFGQSDLLVERI